MSKHPTSELSPRDVACIEYGMKLDTALWCFGERDELCSRYDVADAIKEARAARELIFRCCFECAHCDIEAGYCCKPGKEPCELTWQYDDACTCEHYEERREV